MMVDSLFFVQAPHDRWHLYRREHHLEYQYHSVWRSLFQVDHFIGMGPAIHSISTILSPSYDLNSALVHSFETINAV